MGTTIRREPVNFAIPAAPDYKFLNITNFRGLDVSSNPFELANNTASDCLNVYVDETNTLTTRPRLEKKADALIEGTHIGTYNLHNGYLLHYLQDGVGVLATWIDNVLTQITGKDLTPDEADTSKKEFLELPTTKCEYFEQDDKIYLLDGTRYLVIHENVLSEVVGHVPVTSTVDVTGNKFEVEPLNLLSNTFAEKYYWDGVSNPFGTHLVGEIGTKNNAIKRVKFAQDLSEYSYFLYFTDDTCLLQHKTTGELFYGEIVNNLSTISLQATGIIVSTETEVRYATHVGKSFEALESIYRGTAPYGYYEYRLSDFYYQGNGVWAQQIVYDTGISFDKTLNPTFRFAENDKVYCYTSDDNKSVNFVPINSDDEIFNPDGSLVYSYGWNLSVEEGIGGLFNPGQQTLYPMYVLKRSVENPKICTLTNCPRRSAGLENIVVFESETTNAGFFSEDGNVYYNKWETDDGIFVFTYDMTTTESNTYKFSKEMQLNNFTTSSNGKTFYWFVQKDEQNMLWVAPSGDINNYYNSYLSVDGVLNFSAAPRRIVALSPDANPFDLYYWDKDNTNITTVLELTPNDDGYSEWYDKRQRLLKSNLITRFDNNYWFAEGNRYYRSRNNDPTYFPVIEYNDLGDSNEPITGFNLANDTTLIAYKPNKIYLIQPFESSLNAREYTITESKNTVGNTAINAPIVTTLTEIPLQINSDGIYGLSQLQNVSAVERIADLMSEPINERWLKEDDVVISNAKTINRLYWTYVILPYSDLTKIYLLDNRSNSWYYWELPIAINDAFVKDNVTEFVDKTGVIYYLTPEDVINKAFLPLLVTEYYDYGRKLIPWYWQSQILHLGTMNYSKRLVNTTFILTDTDTQDGYGLQYSFKVFRKLASSTPEKEISDELNLVRSTTKKTNISKFGFVQLKLSNITEESQGTDPEKAYRNNKLRLVGLGLKYVLLEGLIR